MEPSPCCCNPTSPTPTPPTLPMLEKIAPVLKRVCQLALAIFAAYMNIKIFAVAGTAGLLMGIAHGYTHAGKPASEIGVTSPNCGFAVFNYLSEISYPTSVGVVITAAYTAIHVHCSPLYVAFCTVPLGIFVGTQVTQAAWNLYHRDISVPA